MSTMLSSGFISEISPAPIANNNFPKSEVRTLLGDPSTESKLNAPDNSDSNSSSPEFRSACSLVFVVGIASSLFPLPPDPFATLLLRRVGGIFRERKKSRLALSKRSLCIYSRAFVRCSCIRALGCRCVTRALSARARFFLSRIVFI